MHKRGAGFKIGGIDLEKEGSYRLDILYSSMNNGRVEVSVNGKPGGTCFFFFLFLI
jgi:hypothetical protein